jgi:hypothetical protein
MRSQASSRVRFKRTAVTVAIIVVGLIVVGRITGIVVDWLWFSSIDYAKVFWTVISAQTLLFAAVFAASAGAISASGFLAHHYARRPGSWQVEPAHPSATPEIISGLAGQFASYIPWRVSIAGIAIVRLWCNSGASICYSRAFDGHEPMSKLKDLEWLFNGRHFDREVIVLCVRW